MIQGWIVYSTGGVQLTWNYIRSTPKLRDFSRESMSYISGTVRAEEYSNLLGASGQRAQRKDWDKD